MISVTFDRDRGNSNNGKEKSHRCETTNYFTPNRDDTNDNDVDDEAYEIKRPPVYFAIEFQDIIIQCAKQFKPF